MEKLKNYFTISIKIKYFSRHITHALYAAHLYLDQQEHSTHITHFS